MRRGDVYVVCADAACSTRRNRCAAAAAAAADGCDDADDNDETLICVWCFASGGERDDHRSDHRYRVASSLDFPLLEESWTAAMELALVDAVLAIGFDFDLIARMIEGGLFTAHEVRRHFNVALVDRQALAPQQAPLTTRATFLDRVAAQRRARQRRQSLRRGESVEKVIIRNLICMSRAASHSVVGGDAPLTTMAATLAPTLVMDDSVMQRESVDAR